MLLLLLLQSITGSSHNNLKKQKQKVKATVTYLQDLHKRNPSRLQTACTELKSERTGQCKPLLFCIEIIRKLIKPKYRANNALKYLQKDKLGVGPHTLHSTSYVTLLPNYIWNTFVK